MTDYSVEMWILKLLKVNCDSYSIYHDEKLAGIRS